MQNNYKKKSKYGWYFVEFSEIVAIVEFLFETGGNFQHISTAFLYFFLSKLGVNH